MNGPNFTFVETWKSTSATAWQGWSRTMRGKRLSRNLATPKLSVAATRLDQVISTTYGPTRVVLKVRMEMKDTELAKGQDRY